MKTKPGQVTQSLLTTITVYSFLLLFLTSESQQAEAASIQVLKEKGGKAIVKAEGIRLRPGETYQISSDDAVALDDRDESPGQGSAGAAARRFTIALSGGFSISSRTSNPPVPAEDISKTTLSLNARFGWVLKKLEVGPLVSFSSISEGEGGGTETSFGGGGFLDYHLKENRPGVDKLFGFGGAAAFLSDSDGATTTSQLDFEGGPFFKWFLAQSTTAIRIDGKFNYTTGGGIKRTGPELAFGIQSYF